MVDAWVAPSGGQTHFGGVRLVFLSIRSAPPTPVRVGRTRAGWSAVSADGTLLALTPSRRATLACLPHLGLALVAGRPPAVRHAQARGTAFQLKVWQACRAIPAGRTMSYGDLARHIGCRSAQAVGQALARNPLARLIPCHRVVGRRGEGGFAWGASLKRRWLRAEQA